MMINNSGLKVQQYLRSGKSLNSLRGAPYNLLIKEENDLVILKYDLISSDFSEPICNECRGIILHKPTWNVVCFPFIKFWNKEEPFSIQLDENNLHVYQKVDGSFCKVWYYEGYWHLSSNNNIDARNIDINNNNGDSFNFASLFERCLSSYNLSWEEFVKPLNPDYTYMYEMCSPDNQVVIKYNEYKLFYLGQRNIIDYHEEYIPDMRIDNVKVYNFKTFDEIFAASKELPETEEGYVVRDNNFNRVKIKNPIYFMLHELANNGRPDFLKFVITGNESELLAYFPRYKTEIDKIHTRLNNIKMMAEGHRSAAEPFYSFPRGKFAEIISKRGIPPYLQSYIFKTYKNHNLSWEQFTLNWDIYKWKNFLARVGGDT